MAGNQLNRVYRVIFLMMAGVLIALAILIVGVGATKTADDAAAERWIWEATLTRRLALGTPLNPIFQTATAITIYGTPTGATSTPATLPEMTGDADGPPHPVYRFNYYAEIEASWLQYFAESLFEEEPQ